MAKRKMSVASKNLQKAAKPIKKMINKSNAKLAKDKSIGASNIKKAKSEAFNAARKVYNKARNLKRRLTK